MAVVVVGGLLPGASDRQQPRLPEEVPGEADAARGAAVAEAVRRDNGGVSGEIGVDKGRALVRVDDAHEVTGVGEGVHLRNQLVARPVGVEVFNGWVQRGGAERARPVAPSWPTRRATSPDRVST